MSDQTHPDIELLHQVPTRVADVREFQRELVAAAERSDDDRPEDDPPEPPTTHALQLPAAYWDEPEPDAAAFEDDVPTRHIQLPDHLRGESGATADGRFGARFEDTPVVAPFEHTPVPVETVLTRAANSGLRLWAVVGVLVCAGVAINAGFLLGLYVDDEPSADAPAPAKAVAPATGAATPPPEAAGPPTEPAAPAAAVRSVAVPLPVQTVEAEESPLGVARRAIENADPDSAAAALERAREAGAESAVVDRLRARLSVLRGDGATAVDGLRAMTRAYPDDAAIQLALARVLAQAERDDEAERAFRRALELDADSVDAHVGLARLATRATHLGAAREHLRAAREAFERGEPDPVLEARLHVTEGIIGFELGDFAGASSNADSALAVDEKSAEAHLLRGRIAIQQDRDATEHLRAAVAGRAPPAEALGMLVPRAGDDACELAERYLEIAPRGFDAATVRRVQRRCP